MRFHLASSVADTPYRPGEIAAPGDTDFVRLPPLATIVPAPAGSARREVPVQRIAAMTEVGTLELHCVGTDDAARRWRLEFELRGDDSAPAPASLPPRFADAVQAIENVFGSLERLPVERKVEVGDGLLDTLRKRSQGTEGPPRGSLTPSGGGRRETTACGGLGHSARLVGDRPPRRAPPALRQRPPGGAA